MSYTVRGGDTIGPSGETIPEHYSIAYNNLFTYNIAATKELDIVVQTQAALISSLEARITALEG